MDTISNIDKNVESILENLSELDINVDNTSVVGVLNDILTELSNLDVNTTPIVDPLETVFNQSVAANSNTTTIAIDTSLVKKLWIFCTNTASTSLTILVNAVSADNSSDDVTLYPLTLNTTTITGGCFITDLPPYVRFKIINNDVTNASDVTIKISKTR